MSDNPQLARTGTAAGSLVIGTTVITGWWILAAAITVVAVGAILIRFSFRHGRQAGQE